MSPRKELLPGEGICGGLTSLPLAAGVYLKGILVFAMSNFCFSGKFEWCLVFCSHFILLKVRELRIYLPKGVRLRIHGSEQLSYILYASRE